MEREQIASAVEVHLMCLMSRQTQLANTPGIKQQPKSFLNPLPPADITSC
jgi:hypothetical protein